MSDERQFMPPPPDRTAFIRANTRLVAPPLVPQIRLHLADRTTQIWEATEAELAATGTDPPFWAFAWAGGQAVARHILDHEDFSGQRVVDFGIGGGLTAIAAAKKGALCVTGYEIDPLCTVAVALNAQANGLDPGFIHVRTENLLAERVIPVLDCDVIIAADVFYEARPAAAALTFLKAQAAAGIRVIAGDPERRYFPRDAFRRLATYDVPVDPDLEGVTARRTSVWQL